MTVRVGCLAAALAAATTTPSAPATSTSATSAPPTGSLATECLAALPVPFKAAQTVMVAVYGDALASAAERAAEHDLGGAILMTWPAGSDPADLAALRGAGRVPLLIGVDEEGGRVQRLDSLGELPAAADVAAAMTSAEAEMMIATHADAVAALGIDVVFAPVVDVAPADGSGGPIGDRSFGSDPAVVSSFAAAYVEGWQHAGILPVLKHFPGHGSASADTHGGRATTPPLEELRERDLVPYAELADRDVGVMVGHLDVPGLTDDEGVPTSLSAAAINGLLRDDLGYGDALVFTDALEMGAVAGAHGTGEAAVLALIAGADMVLVATDPAAVVDTITVAAHDGRLPAARLDAAVRTILARKAVDPCSIEGAET